ncbi:MAG: VOC family protein [Actinomycetota bacterium]|nr:VOC family protein [Actinomycetota bacterium]
MAMTVRFEIFPRDLDVTVEFYTEVLGFELVSDRRDDPEPYVALRRDSVHVGALRDAAAEQRSERRPPVGVEIVLEVDDVNAELERVRTAGWPIAEGIEQRPWGLRDFRLLDPSGYYLRITNRARTM